MDIDKNNSKEIVWNFNECPVCNDLGCKFCDFGDFKIGSGYEINPETGLVDYVKR